MPLDPVDPARVPSLAVVESELAREESAFQFRAHAVETRAGVAIGAAGAVVALVGAHPSVAGLVAQVLALASGGAAVRALLPRVDKSIGIAPLRDRYLARDPVRTRLIVLNTRIDLHAQDERQLLLKVRALRTAGALLFAATVAIVVGAVIGMF